MSMVLRLVAAILGPALVLGAAGAWYLRPVDHSPTEWVQKLDSQVKASDPEVVILGSSWAETNVDEKVLANRLGVPPAKVLTLSQTASAPPIWYAIAKYRLFGNGAKPKTIVLVAATKMLMGTTLPAKDLPALEQHFVTPDAVLQEKVWGDARSPLITQMLGRRAELRDLLVEQFRLRSLGLWLEPRPDRSLLDMQEAAGAVVFDAVEGNGDAIAHRFLPVVENEDATSASSVSTVGVRDSFLVDLAELARENGSQLVVAIPPVASLQRSNQLLSPAREAELVQVANELGIGWIDLRKMDLDDSNFRADGGHMLDSGARTYTEALANRMLQIGALEEGPLAAATPPATIQKVERIGSPPTLEPARTKVVDEAGCRYGVDLGAWNFLTYGALLDSVGTNAVPVRMKIGEELYVPGPNKNMNDKSCEPLWAFNGPRSLAMLPAGVALDSVEWVLNSELPNPEAEQQSTWWVYPNTRLQWTVADTPAEGTLHVEVAARGLGPSSSPAVLEVDGKTVALVEGAEGLVATLDLPVGAGLRQLALHSPADGPFLVVRRLSMELAGQHTDLVSPPLIHAADVFAVPIAADTPPPIEVGALEKRDRHYGWTLPWDNQLTCSPVQILEDEVALPALATRKPSGKPVGPLVQHVGTFLSFVPPDKSDPRSNNKNYQVVLDPERGCVWKSCRTCPTLRWMYSGDHLSARLDATARKVALGGIRALHIVGESMGGGDPEATLEVEAYFAEQSILTRQVKVSELPAGIDLLFSIFVPRGGTDNLIVDLALSDGAAPLRLSVVATPL